MNMINLFVAVSGMAEKLGSLYKGNRLLCREDLLEFMNVNDWFGASAVMKDSIVSPLSRHKL